MASVTVNPPKTPVTKGSTSIAAATVPNVCKMPGPPAPFVPTPLPNIGKSGDSPDGYSTSVTIEGNAVAIQGASFKSMGDVASQGTGGGIVSNNTQGATKFVAPGSMDVKIEGKNVQYLGDQMSNNNGPSGSPPNAATLTGVIHAPGITYVHGRETCPLCGEEHGEAQALAESNESKAGVDSLHAAVQAAPPDSEPKVATMLGVVHCGHKHFAANSGIMKGFVASAAQRLGMVHPPASPTATSKALWRMVCNAKKIAPTDWEKVVAQAHRAYVRAGKDNSVPSANFPGACAGTRVVVLALDCGAVPKSLSEVWFDPDGEPMDRPMSHWQEIRPGRLRYVPDRWFGAGDHVPPCQTCCIILPALMCNVNKARPCDGHAPRTRN